MKCVKRLRLKTNADMTWSVSRIAVEAFSLLLPCLPPCVSCLFPHKSPQNTGAENSGEHY